MAVDPLTAKILAQIAGQAVTDEQARKRLLIIILIPVITFIMLITLILYLITSPFSVLAQWLIGDELSVVEDFQKDYGYNQAFSVYDPDYINGIGKSYEGVVFKDSSMDVVYYNQFDERWANIMYGQSSTIGDAGCGPTAMSIVISTLTGEVHDPIELANWSVAHKQRCEGNGSYHTLIPTASKGYGLSCKGDLSAQDIVDALSSGKLVVAIMSKGHFTRGGHFIVLRGVTADGKILVADPGSHSRSNQTWDLSLIINEARKDADAGGPFWAIGN